MACKLFPKLFIWIFLFWNQGCSSSETENQLLTIIINAANEINKLMQLVAGRQDFNRWFLKRQWRLQDTTDEEYDFIIVGSGSAGSVIANRLSEIKAWKILLLECGVPETGLMAVPVLAAAFQFTPYNWGYFMEYQEGNFFGLNHNRMHWPRGKALGGTSVINYMIYTRGNRWDYDRWAADGNPGWSYEDVLPYFIKSERAHKLTEYEPRFHGTRGYQSVENIYRSLVTDAFIESGPYIGLPHIDYNANQSYGVAQIQATVRNGRRDSVASSYLYPVRERTNLHITIEAFVTKVLIDDKTKTARGVTYEKRGKKYTVWAKKEVILSAGTFMSPQLLMLSGVGPKKHLNELGIKVVSNLPVGRNLQDHLCFPGLAFEINQPIDLKIRNVLRSTDTYLVNGTGPYTSLGGVEGIGYVQTPGAPYPKDVPNVELLFIGGTLASDGGTFTYRGMNIRDEVFDSIFRQIINGNAWTIFPMLLRPESIGYMELKSTNPWDHPRLYGNFFTDAKGQDLETFVQAIRIIQELARAPPFQKYGSRLNPRPMYTCQHLTFDSDDYWRCCVKSISVTLHHQVGTAKMGPSDRTAVVNNNLQVYGVKNLRVADCSIIPRALGAHTNAPSIMIGEKAADIIKFHWGAPVDPIIF